MIVTLSQETQDHEVVSSCLNLENEFQLNYSTESRSITDVISRRRGKFYNHEVLDYCVVFFGNTIYSHRKLELSAVGRTAIYFSLPDCILMWFSVSLNLDATKGL